MRLNYKENTYELTELIDPKDRASFDIIAIFKVRNCKWDNNKLVNCTEEESETELLDFITYFYGASDNEDILIKDAKSRIDYVLSKGDRL